MLKTLPDGAAKQKSVQQAAESFSKVTDDATQEDIDEQLQELVQQLDGFRERVQMMSVELGLCLDAVNKLDELTEKLGTWLRNTNQRMKVETGLQLDLPSKQQQLELFQASL